MVLAPISTLRGVSVLAATGSAAGPTLKPATTLWGQTATADILFLIQLHRLWCWLPPASWLSRSRK